MPVEQVIEEKRSRLAERARGARTNFERGSAKTGSLKGLMERIWIVISAVWFAFVFTPEAQNGKNAQPA